MNGLTERPPNTSGLRSALLIALTLIASSATADCPSAALEARVSAHEGFESHAYRDTRQFLTIGIGHRISAPPSRPWTRAHAERVLAADLTAACANAAAEVGSAWQGLSLTRKSVLAESAFVLGESGLHEFQRMLAAVRKGDWQGAAAAMLDSRWHTEEPGRVEELAGLLGIVGMD